MGIRTKLYILLFSIIVYMALQSVVGCGGSGGSTGPALNPVPSNPNEWMWVSGSDTANQVGALGTGSYGTLGVASPTNNPGPRKGAMTWADATGNLWLFGGYGNDSTSGFCELNDLWKYSAGEWTWMGGSNLPDQAGVYGTLGTASSSNIPGARQDAATWADAMGNLWLFGGEYVQKSPYNNLIALQDYNDLWRYSGGKWTWMGGSKPNPLQPIVSGSYGTQGKASPSNIPGARFDAVTWVDKNGNLWLFGGNGWDSAEDEGYLNDLWEYSGGEWTWVSGSNVNNQPGSYGTQGMAAAGNTPGARFGAVGWTDTSGNFWLFGGVGATSNGQEGALNDLWEYSGGQWIWMSGSDVPDQPGSYGTKGVAAAGNAPAARYEAVSWTDASGNFWLFGGRSGSGRFNDLWKYSGGKWTWMSGSDQPGQSGVYGSQGTAAAANTPGARYSPAAWTDKDGNLWLLGGATGPFTWFNDLWVYKP